MEKMVIKVRLDGVSDIMFDKFIDHSEEDRPPEQKLYLAKGNKLVFPAENFYSFLFGDKVPGAIKTIEQKKAKPYIQHQSFVSVSPSVIPFLDGQDEIIFKDFKDNRFWIHEGSPVVKSSSGQIVKQEMKKRPTMHLPWGLEFEITLLKNDVITEPKLHNWFVAGGFLVAIGTYRPRFGRFEVTTWKEKSV